MNIPTEQWTLEPCEKVDPPELGGSWSIKPGYLVDGRRSCAELAALARLRDDGWDGVWVSAYQSFFRREWFPADSFKTIADAGAPADVAAVFERLREANGGKLGGFWDVFAWRDGKVRFVEVKIPPDYLKPNQRRFMDMALGLGHDVDEFLIVVA